ncbi:hypothetical protein K4K54_006492 [Colletotrichum sp. SAR 10_86]|nr:hypothetical protein K4K51_006033 [Colletotrichum sp. SAR 10_75]KAI8197235.1 hypothetical protein KHU50_009691 [Colletotrichum sp. SAR 10_65]KAI8222933.1 hypothetical protein K4K54_006492 [Colletotrichum sp. SAR 10_86]KAI8252665.1 hypothetical protein K4K53_010960 [Colletotrichum sp. SAR 10_77]
MQVNMADPHIILETHLYSLPPNGAPPWIRSFHLRLCPTAATKGDILTLVRNSVVRIGRADPVVEAQVTLFFTRNGHVASLPGASNLGTNTVAVPIYQPAHLINYSVPCFPQQQQLGAPGWPLALTYANGVNWLHSYGPGGMMGMGGGQQQQQVIVGGQIGFINVNVPSVNISGGRPVVSDVVREARLDGIAGAALGGMLEWVGGPNGLKLIVIVDVDGRDVLPAVITLPEAPAVATPPAAPATSPPVAEDAPAEPAAE